MDVTYATGKNRAAHTRGVATSKKEQARKPGRYGTLYAYRLVYRDVDPGSPDFTSRVWRYDLEHVFDAWLESLAEDPDWVLVRIEALREES